ncbi:MAG: hypothetical protein A2218_11390 [Elusimicrobia bacterium RIFOXYA2_FULL_53_38]|nr:MAG: hypothetical protein A2218_11390 [Elusimicrobia bacterium RIFOXYA2_FULL_53_38]
MKFNIWTNPAFYTVAGVFALSLFLLVFSIRKYLELKNGSDFEESGGEAEEVQGELPLPAVDEAAQESDAANQTPAAEEYSEPAPAPGDNAELPRASSRAEEFVKGIYENMSSFDGRLKNIEAAFSKISVNKDFTVTFLEDIISDYDSLDKEKIKARIQYLVADLKK